MQQDNLYEEKKHNKQLNPVVDMGVTLIIGSDKYVYTIIDVNNSKKQIKIQQDICKRTDSNGQSVDQTYEYYNNPNGKIIILSLRNNSYWKEFGKTSKQDKCRYDIGTRSRYSDPNF